MGVLRQNLTGHNLCLYIIKQLIHIAQLYSALNNNNTLQRLQKLVIIMKRSTPESYSMLGTVIAKLAHCWFHLKTMLN